MPGTSVSAETGTGTVVRSRQPKTNTAIILLKPSFIIIASFLYCSTNRIFTGISGKSSRGDITTIYPCLPESCTGASSSMKKVSNCVLM
jgi:hypothetical protein